MARLADHPATALVLAAFAFGFAAAGARPFAGSWNDGSRLASVESLVERGGFCIDGTVFLSPPKELFDRGTPPYDPDNTVLRHGTLDKLVINGRSYSDKPPLVSVPLAAAYRALMALGLPTPSERPDVFAWVITVLLSGVGYASAVGCMWIIGCRVGLTPGWRLAWLGAFALATMLPAYTRHANNHIAQLGAVAGICVLLYRIADHAADGRMAWWSLLGAGMLTGFAYNLDFGVGLPLLPAVFAAVVLRTLRIWPTVLFAMAVLPCLVAGHWINYAIGGDWLFPLNMHPEYLRWPGSPFETTMTGVVRPRPLAQTAYSLDLLVGKKGFLTHNLPLLLAVAAGLQLLKQPGRHRLELTALGAWALVAWLLYGVLSKNHGGGCVSIRWFVPFLAPGFWLLGAVLNKRPQFRADFIALALWGAALSASAWLVGPWRLPLVPGYWILLGGALLTWAAVRYHATRVTTERLTVLAPRS